MKAEQSKGFIEVYDIIEQIRTMARQSQSCFSCEHIDMENNVCGKFNNLPPLRIIHVGCQYYSPDIPF